MDLEETKTVLAVRIQELRLAKGLTQQQLAQALDLKWSEIEDIETGKSNLRLLFLVSLADKPGVPLHELFQ